MERINCGIDEITESNSPVLMAGQSYAVVVALNMPESPKNLDLGMFMSCLQMRSTHRNRPKEGGIIRVAKIKLFLNL